MFNGEEFFFNEDDKSIKDYIMPNTTFQVYTADTDDLVHTMWIDPSKLDPWIVPYISEIDGKCADGFARNSLPANLKNIESPLRAYIYVDGDRLSIDAKELEQQIKDVLARVARVKRNTYKFKELWKSCKPGSLDESAREPEDVVTVEDFIELLRKKTDLDDKVVFRSDKDEKVLIDLNSKAGVAVIDLTDAKDMSDRLDEMEDDEGVPRYLTLEEIKELSPEDVEDLTPEQLEEQHEVIAQIEREKEAEMEKNALTPKQWQDAADWFTANGYEIEDDEDRLEELMPQLDQFAFKKGCSPNGKDEVIDGKDAYALYLKMKKDNKQMTNEGKGRSWYGGGYGGTGKAYSRLSRAPRGAEISWYSAGDLDPAAKGKMPGWRVGPSNFPFADLLYPERKYRVGTMVLRNKYIKAGELSGEKYIALPSYFDAQRNNDAEALNLLSLLGIPLGLKFGMDPDDDYSVTYTA